MSPAEIFTRHAKCYARVSVFFFFLFFFCFCFFFLGGGLLLFFCCCFFCCCCFVFCLFVLLLLLFCFFVCLFFLVFCSSLCVVCTKRFITLEYGLIDKRTEILCLRKTQKVRSTRTIFVFIGSMCGIDKLIVRFYQSN